MIVFVSDGGSCCPWCTETFSDLRVLLNHWEHCKSRQQLQDSVDSSSASDSDTTGSIDIGDKNNSDDDITIAEPNGTGRSREGQTESPNPYSCEQCNISFKNLYDLTVHNELHHKSQSKKCSCSICGAQFSSNSLLYVHIQNHPETKADLLQHVLSHADQILFYCNQCDLKFHLQADLQKHVLSHPKQKIFSCLECGKGFSKGSDLRRHNLVHTGERPFPCYECGSKFGTSSQLKRHAIIHTGIRPYACTECDMRFYKGSDLTRHMRTHSGEKLLKCDFCGSDLKKHSQVHFQQKRFPCLECGKSFGKKSDFKRHSAIHMKLKPFVCGDCGVCFALESQLRRHSVTHGAQSESSHSLQQANDTYGYIWNQVSSAIDVYKDYLAQGLATSNSVPKSNEEMNGNSKHSSSEGVPNVKSKPAAENWEYSCSMCGEGFNKASKLVKHSLTHSNETGAVCAVCKAEVGSQVALESHILTHIEEKPFLCIECGDEFHTENELESHCSYHMKQN
ncbi:hypothetical protein ONE63_001431 [Megalurothrips usitatus]|uniref:C2H2-type domain-containing protein n=1 Tax=Megalurothrips usitatus TaxID=439358 RepID=A0AAV7XIY6_9NEOP|nr:hypothetical protein ONE63_001431 [Megalurothrips usitatus]